MEIMVKKLSSETEKDFFTLRKDTSCDWCFCTAWHVPTWDGWDKRTALENRTLREELFRQGRYDGYLLYENDTPIGWCQCAPLSWFPKLMKQKNFDDEPGTFVISCLEILPTYRKRGLSRKLLQAVISDLKTRETRRVLALPVSGKHPDGDVWTGPASLFESAGFKVKTKSDDCLTMEFIF